MVAIFKIKSQLQFAILAINKTKIDIIKLLGNKLKPDKNQLSNYKLVFYLSNS